MIYTEINDCIFNVITLYNALILNSIIIGQGGMRYIIYFI